MVQITSVLKKKIVQLTGEIEKLQSQRSALESALQSIAGGTGRTRRRSVPAHAVARVSRTKGTRRKRGANQEKVLSLLGRSPRRLNELAADAKLTMSATGGVLRGLIVKGLAVKGSKRGTYVLKAGPATKSAARSTSRPTAAA
jgi:hypothetical protein